MIVSDVGPAISHCGEGQDVGCGSSAVVDRPDLAEVAFLVDSDTSRPKLNSIEEDRMRRFPYAREKAHLTEAWLSKSTWLRVNRATSSVVMNAASMLSSSSSE